MIKITQIKIAVGPDGPLPEKKRERKLRAKAAGLLHIRPSRIAALLIERRSLDARRKPQLYEVFTVRVSLFGENGEPMEEAAEQALAARMKNGYVSVAVPRTVSFPARTALLPEERRPVVAGSGPAGLFCAFMLAKYGYRPRLIERGRAVEARLKDVERAFESGVTDPESNVQFGEGGAGTFSDGKLYTSAKDTDGRFRRILELFAAHGAPKDILYEANPHIGTDCLAGVVRSLREAILAYGGEVFFETRLTGLRLRGEGSARRVCGIVTNRGEIKAEQVVLATGHSARDTFAALLKGGIRMEQKAFAVGVRTAHLQENINRAMYGAGHPPGLEPASYRLTHTAKSGSGVYTFCMCPGGFIINASSGREGICVNGMSMRDRGAAYANSAVVRTVSPEEAARFAGAPGDVLAGVRFQEMLEKHAHLAGNGFVPVQSMGAFLGSEENGDHSLCLSAEKAVRGVFRAGDVRSVLPREILCDIREGIAAFDKKLKGFASPGALVAGVESRTSSPVRIVREKSLEAAGVAGLYPCGEGAGYAGGIMSAAADGIRVAEALAGKCRI